MSNKVGNKFGIADFSPRIMLFLYNTLNHKKEEFKPLKQPLVTYYSCGPTVYDFTHIGHARTYIFADVLQRVLEFNGFKVKRVMNITDVGHLTSDSDTGEDKMELALRRSKLASKGSGRAATSAKKTIWEIAKYYTDDFFKMTDKLNIKRPQIICKATDFVTSMVRFIEILEKKGFTYTTSDGVYFDTSKFPKYGQLAGWTFAQLQKKLKSGARVEMVTGKKHPTDFALWKLTPAGVSRQMEWDSPWGRGFPGWHIECSVMAIDNLGETIDIHTGGADHIPIHHTNEIAQSEAATGKQFVRYWLHADHLLVENQKMSKSLGNFFRLKDLEKKGFYPLSLRYLFLTSSYHQQMNFTWKSLEGAQNAYQGLIKQIIEIKKESIKLSSRGMHQPVRPVAIPQELLQHNGIASPSSETRDRNDNITGVDQLRMEFFQAVNDDLNTAEGLSVLWKVLKSSLPSGDKYDLIILFDEVLGLGFNEIKVERTVIPEEIKNLAVKREEMRKAKKFKEADDLRKQILEKGYSVKDSPSGPKLFSL